MARNDENALVQAAAVLDAVIAALKGEPVSEFFESFYPVRTVRDLMVRAEKAVGYREGHPLMCCGKCHDTLAASEERARRAEQALREIRDAACGFDVSVGSVPETTVKAVRALARMVQEELATKARVRKVADHLGNLADLKKRSVSTIREAYAHAQELVLNALLAAPPPAATETRDEIRPLSFDVSAEWVRRPVHTIVPDPTDPDPEEILP